MPAFSSDQNAYVERAVSVYKSLLPDHEVVVIDTSTLKKLEGSVHCLSINVPKFASLPSRYLSLQKAITYIKKADAEAAKKKAAAEAAERKAAEKRAAVKNAALMKAAQQRAAAKNAALRNAASQSTVRKRVQAVK